MKMNKLFVPYGIALELKELGFDETCFAKYFQQDGNPAFLCIGEKEIKKAENVGSDVTFECLAPLFQQVQDWFDEKKFQIYAFKLAGNWYWKIIDDNFSTVEYCVTSNGFKDKRTALIKGILKAIELIKSNESNASR